MNSIDTTQITMTSSLIPYFRFDQKFWSEFLEISWGEWYRIFWLTAPEWKTLAFLLALEIFNDLEVIIDQLLVEDDGTIVLCHWLLPLMTQFK